jgi:hypothetical protein
MQDAITRAGEVDGPHPTDARFKPQKEEAPLKCDDCGCIGGSTQATFCPYSADINNDPEVPANLCHSCYQQRCDDI